MVGTPTFYTTSFVLAMNRGKYDGLPAELRRVIDANSGQPAAAMAAVPWDEQGPVVEERVRARGNQIYALPEAEKARWQAATRPVVDAWVAQMKDRGLDGGALIEEARALIAQAA